MLDGAQVYLTPTCSAKGKLQVSFSLVPELAQRAQAEIGVEIPTDHKVRSHHVRLC